jgi:glycosyltransferase involved in cell wall biosynthesis
MQIQSPRLTVLLPVYNGAPYLKESIQSVLSQSFQDFQLLVINDGSTDGTDDIIAEFHDPRVRELRHSSNHGLVKTLNEGLDIIHTEYVARMDADDICHPERFYKQIAFLDQNSEVGVCGTQAMSINQEGKAIGPLHFPLRHQDILAQMLLYCPILHPTAMMRMSLFHSGIIRYRIEYPHAEDYALWEELSAITHFANLPESLLNYRQYSNQVSQRHAEAQVMSDRKIKGKILAAAECQDPEWKAAVLHFSWFKTPIYPYTAIQLDSILDEWSLKLQEKRLFSEATKNAYVRFYCQKCRELRRITFFLPLLFSRYLAKQKINRVKLAVVFSIKVAMLTFYMKWICESKD